MKNRPNDYSTRRDAAAEISLFQTISRTTLPGPGSTYEWGFKAGADWVWKEYLALEKENIKLRADNEKFRWSLTGAQVETVAMREALKIYAAIDESWLSLWLVALFRKRIGNMARQALRKFASKENK